MHCLIEVFFIFIFSAVNSKMEQNMAEESEYQLRRRRRTGNNPSFMLNLDPGYQVDEGGPSRGTPSPSCYQPGPPGRSGPSYKDHPVSSALFEFRKKQQSFDIQIEECEEEEIVIESDDEDGGEESSEVTEADRPVTPTPVQDFAANVVYTEGPQAMDFLQIKAIEQDCITDVSDAETDEENE